MLLPNKYGLSVCVSLFLATQQFRIYLNSQGLNDMHRGYEVKEALRAQMEVQSKLHLQVEVSIPNLPFLQSNSEKYRDVEYKI